MRDLAVVDGECLEAACLLMTIEAKLPNISCSTLYFVKATGCFRKKLHKV